MTPEEFRQAGHALIDWIADYRSELEQRPVRAQVKSDLGDNQHQECRRWQS